VGVGIAAVGLAAAVYSATSRSDKVILSRAAVGEPKLVDDARSRRG